MMRISLTIYCIVVLAYLVGCQQKFATQVSAENVSLERQADSNDCYTKLIPFWPASKEENRIIKRQNVVSQYTTLDSNKILKYENEIVEVIFDIQDVIEQFDKSFEEHSNLKCDKVLTERFRKESEIRSLICYSEFSGEDNERLHYCIADLLEDGKFVIKLNNNGEIVSQIIVCEWSNVRGWLDGVGGRVFYLKDGRIFFWTADWIS